MFFIRLRVLCVVEEINVDGENLTNLSFAVDVALFNKIKKKMKSDRTHTTKEEIYARIRASWNCLGGKKQGNTSR